MAMNMLNTNNVLMLFIAAMVVAFLMGNVVLPVEQKPRSMKTSDGGSGTAALGAFYPQYAFPTDLTSGEEDLSGLVPSPDKYLENIQVLDAKWSIGRDTKATSMRNVSLDIRDAPHVKKTLTPANNAFMNSSISHDWEWKHKLVSVKDCPV